PGEPLINADKSFASIVRSNPNQPEPGSGGKGFVGIIIGSGQNRHICNQSVAMSTPDEISGYNIYRQELDGTRLGTNNLPIFDGMNDLRKMGFADLGSHWLNYNDGDDETPNDGAGSVSIKLIRAAGVQSFDCDDHGTHGAGSLECGDGSDAVMAVKDGAKGSILWVNQDYSSPIT